MLPPWNGRSGRDARRWPASGAVVRIGNAFGVGHHTPSDQHGVAPPDADVELEAQAFDFRAIDDRLAPRDSVGLRRRRAHCSNIRARRRRSALLWRRSLVTARTQRCVRAVCER